MLGLELVLVLVQWFSHSPRPWGSWLLRGGAPSFLPWKTIHKTASWCGWRFSYYLALSFLLAICSQLQTCSVSVDEKEPVSLSPSVAGPLESQPPRGCLWPPKVPWPVGGMSGIWTPVSGPPLPCTRCFLLWEVKFYLVVNPVWWGVTVLFFEPAVCCFERVFAPNNSYTTVPVRVHVH